MHDLGPFNSNQSNKLLNVINLVIAYLILIYWEFWISILARSLGCNFAILLCTFSHRYFEFQEWERILLKRWHARVPEFLWLSMFVMFSMLFKFWSKFFIKRRQFWSFQTTKKNPLPNSDEHKYHIFFFSELVPPNSLLAIGVVPAAGWGNSNQDRY